jgi:hypothetical protein
MTDPESLSGQILTRVTGNGELTPDWSKAFATVAQHRFIPNTI